MWRSGAREDRCHILEQWQGAEQDGTGTETRERRQQTTMRMKEYLMKYLEERIGMLDNCKS